MNKRLVPLITSLLAITGFFAVSNAYAVTRTCDATATVSLTAKYRVNASSPWRYQYVGEATASGIVGVGQSNARKNKKSKARAKARNTIRACYDRQLNSLKDHSWRHWYVTDGVTRSCNMNNLTWDNDQSLIIEAYTAAAESPITTGNSQDGWYPNVVASDKRYLVTIDLNIIGPDRCEGKDITEAFEARDY